MSIKIKDVGVEGQRSGVLFFCFANGRTGGLKFVGLRGRGRGLGGLGGLGGFGGFGFGKHGQPT